MTIPRVSSQVTSHSTSLEGSALAPCTTAFANASLSASWTASSFPPAHCICLTSCIMPCTTGSTQFLSPARVTLSFKINLSASKVQVERLGQSQLHQKLILLRNCTGRRHVGKVEDKVVSPIPAMA